MLILRNEFFLKGGRQSFEAAQCKACVFVFDLLVKSTVVHCNYLPNVQGCPGQSRDLTNFKSLSKDPGITYFVQGFHASVG